LVFSLEQWVITWNNQLKLVSVYDIKLISILLHLIINKFNGLMQKAIKILDGKTRMYLQLDINMHKIIGYLEQDITMLHTLLQKHLVVHKSFLQEVMHKQEEMPLTSLIF